jgi:Holliday junction DNA helicase RuvA
MIHALAGITQSRRKQAIVYAVGPIYFEINVADESLFDIDKPCSLFTYLHWNPEQGPQLYGFKKEVERELFLLITSCSGIGPRIGLAILADLGVSPFIHAIRNGDDRMLSKVNGIGVKKAEQIIVQLKHKVHDFVASDIDVNEQSSVDWHTISDALKALNYSRNEISQAIAFVRDKNHPNALSFDQVLRQALSFLSKQQ